MVSGITIVVCLLIFIILGGGWIAGYQYLKDKGPQYLVRFYLIYAIFRILTVLSVAVVSIFFISGSTAESKSFVLMLFTMYVLMMALTLIMKH